MTNQQILASDASGSQTEKPTDQMKPGVTGSQNTHLERTVLCGDNEQLEMCMLFVHLNFRKYVFGGTKQRTS